MGNMRSHILKVAVTRCFVAKDLVQACVQHWKYNKLCLESRQIYLYTSYLGDLAQPSHVSIVKICV